MVDETDSSTGEPNATSETTADVPVQASSTYKMLGDLKNGSGAGVLGRNTASTRTATGVERAVPDADDGSRLHTPGDATVDGMVGVATATVDSLSITSSLSASGVRFVTGPGPVTSITSGGAVWSNSSSRSVKTNVDPVDPEAILAGVEEMPISTWEYEDDDGGGTGSRRIGPMAEDFHEVVDVGGSDSHINSLDADGVALAAIKGLVDRLGQRDERIEAQTERIDELEDRLAALEEQLTDPDAADMEARQ